MSDKKYYQVKLTRPSEDIPGGMSVMRGWVEERAAKRGATVEVLPDKGLWKVAQVFEETPILEVVLKETQRQRRGVPPSLQRQR